MQFPESWLREFCNPPLSTRQLAETLTMAGLEVEELKPVAPPFTKIVVGEIKEAVQHPNADRLRVCKVDVGQATLLDIVCGCAKWMWVNQSCSISCAARPMPALASKYLLPWWVPSCRLAKTVKLY